MSDSLQPHRQQPTRLPHLGASLKKRKERLLVRTWSNWNLCACLAGMQNSAAMMENSVVVSQEVKHKIATGTGNLTSQVALMIKNPPANPRDTGSIPGWGRLPGEGNSNPLQYSCLENPTDRGAWWATYSPWGRKELDPTEAAQHTPSTCVPKAVRTANASHCGAGHPRFNTEVLLKSGLT